jgi:short-subunit dehydrogenase
MTQMIVVTGAGTGIGQAIAKNLASRQYGLLLLGRTESTLKIHWKTLTHTSTFPAISEKKKILEKLWLQAG